MSLTVYQLAHSPYCIPVTRALEALGVPHTVRNVSNGDRTEILKLTGGAYYQVPVLEHNGKVIFESAPDSLDIARYIDATFAAGRLFPDEHEGIQRIVLANIENELEGATFRLVDPCVVAGISDPAERGMVRRHKERKFGPGCLESWSTQRDSILRNAVALLEPYALALRHRPYLFGATPVYADFALFGILGNMTYGGHHALPASLPALNAWHVRMTSFRFPAA
ncbi:MAG TPA: glutathione S-transferase family protein [Terrimicrobiaceae bacterium]|nr:glutathione S-transferase family protein [Terrimicrobiaceae bacterium]